MPAMIWVMASCVDDLAFEPGLRDLPGSSPRRKNTACSRPEPQPARFGQRGGRRVLVVGHEQVELLDIAGQRRNRGRRQPLAGVASRVLHRWRAGDRGSPA